MTFLIDTDIVIELLNRDPVTSEFVEQLSGQGISISIVTYMEVFQGILRSPNRTAAQQSFEDFLFGVPVIAFTEEVARRCALLRENLQTRGKRIRPRALDLITAATALHHGLTLVTRNVEDFKDIPSLSLL